MNDKKYHVSCRVRDNEAGLDAEVHEHADITIVGDTALAALIVWLAGVGNEKSWLRCSPEAITSLLDTYDSGELGAIGWDSNEDGGDKAEAGYHNDWETGHLDYDKEFDTLDLDGTCCLSRWEFEVRIKAV